METEFQLDQVCFMPVEDTVVALRSSIDHGLTNEDAERRAKEFGSNELRNKRRTIPLWMRLLYRHTITLMNAVLIIAIILSAIVKDWIDVAVILLIIVVNVIIGFVQEYKAEHTIAKLKSLTAAKCTVRRDGKVFSVVSTDLVPGDIVLLKEGDLVPADLRIIESISLSCNEALLTGESVPVEKYSTHMERVNHSNGLPPIAERSNCAFMSTTVSKGKATAVVVSTGMQTEIGAIAKVLGESKSQETPLQRKLTYMSIVIVVAAVLSLVLVIVCARIYDGKQAIFPEALVTGSSVAVCIIPGCLITVITLTMAVGISTMAKQNAIVRRMAALESLGNVTDICSDKTGTLTEGSMSVTHIWTYDQEYEVVSTSPNEATMHCTKTQEEVVELTQTMHELLSVCALCNNSTLFLQTSSELEPVAESKNEMIISINPEEAESKWISTGDPTELALNALSQQFGMGKESLEKKFSQKIVEYPFDSTIKRMSVVYTNGDSEMVTVLSKGAPDRILDLCSSISTESGLISMDSDVIEKINSQINSMAAKGLRVLCTAYGERAFRRDTLTREDVEQNLTLVSLVGIQDPPRKEVPEAIRMCHEAGIIVHMLTGDHLSTAAAIARQVGILQEQDLQKENCIMNATDFDNLSDIELSSMTSLPLVIARCSPQTKVKMVKALHSRKMQCAMTGDGINDSPAIRDADVGIAMNSGSDVTKDVSDIVLADDNFASIVVAIHQGRRIFSNIRKFVVHLLSSNVAMLIALLVPIVLSYKIPLNATQILYSNLVTCSPPAIALGVERASKSLMDKRHHHVGESLFNIETLMDIAVYGILMGATMLASYFIVLLSLGRSLESSRSVVLTSIVMLILVHAYNCRHKRRPIFADRVWKSYWLHLSTLLGVAIQCMVLYIPKLNTVVFKQNPLRADEWGIVLAGVLIFVASVELYKLVKRLVFHCKSRHNNQELRAD